MKINKNHSRRNFLKMATMSTAGLALAGTTSSFGEMTSTVDSHGKARDSGELLKLGVATYSLREFDRSKAISMIKEVGARYVNIKSFHASEDASPSQLRAARREFEDAGLIISGGGVVNLRNGDDDFFRQRFEYGKLLGFPVMIVNLEVSDLSRLEKFVKEYDLKVAIHNHSSPGAIFPSPQAVMKHIKNMDPRVGICNDLGHTAINGVDLMESIDAAGERMYDIHLKDFKDLSDRETQCAVGEGSMPIAQIFHKLVQVNYKGPIGLEYEIEPENPLPAMKQSFSYMRGVTDGLHEMLVA